MVQELRNESHRLVVCLFCGTRTFVPASAARDTVSLPESGPGVTLVRCHLCRKEAPYSASEIFRNPEVSLPGDNSRSRAAGI
jgi:hypothetical protein